MNLSFETIVFNGNALFSHENFYNDINLGQSLSKTIKRSLYIVKEQQK